MKVGAPESPPPRGAKVVLQRLWSQAAEGPRPRPAWKEAALAEHSSFPPRCRFRNEALQKGAGSVHACSVASRAEGEVGLSPTQPCLCFGSFHTRAQPWKKGVRQKACPCSCAECLCSPPLWHLPETWAGLPRQGLAPPDWAGRHTNNSGCRLPGQSEAGRGTPLRG